MGHHNLAVSEHCEPCAADERRGDLLNAAVNLIQTEDDRLEGFDKLRETAVKYLQKQFDMEVLPSL